MPIYTYQCPSCNEAVDLLRDVEDRKKVVPCSCSSGSAKMRRPETFRADVFEAYYDEGLGSDVYSSEDRKAIMKGLNVVESGDKVHGGRNFDEKAKVKIEKQEPQGIRRMEAKDETEQIVQVVDSGGDISESVSFRELPNASASKGDSEKSFEKAWAEAITER
mgnify:CR=1 FL=1